VAIVLTIKCWGYVFEVSILTPNFYPLVLLCQAEPRAERRPNEAPNLAEPNRLQASSRLLLGGSKVGFLINAERNCQVFY